MTGGFKTTAALSALFAASGMLMLTGTSASAADLGGNCCADLEERIAELEATTARKGNRKVKLEIYGQINQAVMFWDDGVESNAYVVTNDNARSRFGFKGSATIADGWKAGYNLEIGIRTANSKRTTQLDTVAVTNGGWDVRHAYWYIESKDHGRVSIGVTGSAKEGITEINLAQTKDVFKYSDIEDSGMGMRLRRADGALSTTQAFRLLREYGDQPGEGDRRNQVKYTTPEFKGFTATAAWGTDDFWDIGLNYKGEFSGFKVAAGIGYGENMDESASSDDINFGCPSRGPGANNGVNCNEVGGSISVMHEETGLYGNFAAGQLKDEKTKTSARFQGTTVDDTYTFYAFEGGIERKFIDLGKTTLFGQYYHYDGGGISQRGGGFTAGAGNGPAILSSEVESYGFGIVQGIDAAAMSLYLTYRHYDLEMTTYNSVGAVRSTPNLEDLDVVMGGGLIKF